jgi:hypothetical protein
MRQAVRRCPETPKRHSGRQRRNRPRLCVRSPVRPLGSRTPRWTRPPQRRCCRWPSCGTRPEHRLAMRRGSRTPAVHSAASGPGSVHRRNTSGHERRGCGRRAAAVLPRRQPLTPVAGHLIAAGHTLPGHPVRPQGDLAALGQAAGSSGNGQSAARSGSLQLPLLFLKAGPAGGRLRRPSSAGNDTTATGAPASPSTGGGAGAATSMPRGPRWVRTAAGTTGHQRARAVTSGMQEPQVRPGSTLRPHPAKEPGAGFKSPLRHPT